MKVLKATPEQLTALDGYKNGTAELRFATDGNGNKIVGKSVLTDSAFAAIHKQLAQLEEIDFVPVDEDALA